jgi:hypothetical protein
LQLQSLSLALSRQIASGLRSRGWSCAGQELYRGSLREWPEEFCELTVQAPDFVSGDLHRFLIVIES